jgi:hypothetical protein
MLRSAGRQLFSFRQLISKMGLIYLLSVSFMILSVLAVNLIPNEPILKNLRLSLPSENYSVLFGSTMTDQWTECVAATVGIGRDTSELGLIRRSLLSPMLNNCEIGWHFLKDGTGEPNYSNYYWRYWHGTQIIMRPALAITSVLNIRALTFFLFVSSFMYAFLTLYHYGLRLPGLALFVGLFFVHLQSALFVLPHAADWVIGFLACGWIVTKLNGNVSISLNTFSCAFFLVGLLSAFFGLLNNPLVSLTIPLFGVFSAVAFQKEKDAVGSLVLVLAATCFWFIGYVASWSTKWLLTLFFVDGVFSEISRHATFWMGGSDNAVEGTWTNLVIAVLRQNRMSGVIAIAFLILSFMPLVRFLKTVERKWTDLTSFVFICALPLIWFAALKTHTIVHAWFVSAELYISFVMVFSLLFTSWALKSSLFARDRARL